MLEVETDIGTVVLRVSNDGVSVDDSGATDWLVTIPQNYLAQLVMGYRSIGEIALEPSVEIDSEAIALLDTLFPTGMPWLPAPDWF